MREDMLSQLEEIQSNVREIKSTWSKTIMTLDNIKSSLKADRQKALEEARKKGYEEAETIWTAPSSKNEFYRKGLDDAWEAARKIVTWPNRSLVNSDTFDLDPGENIFTKYSASRAIEKLKAFEEKQKANREIKVGDTVDLKDSVSDKGDGIVTKIFGDDYCYIVWYDGSGGAWAKDMLVKTGKHIDIASILKEINYES